MNHAFGYIPDKKDKKDFIYGNTFHRMIVPPFIDYRSEMTRVKSQGAKGSCVAFALCAVKEWQEYAQRGFTNKWDLSEEFLYDHVQVYPGGGSYPRDALKVMHKIGVPLEKQFPYVRQTDKYQLHAPVKDRKDPESMRMFNTARRFRASGYVRLRNVSEVMQSLATNGPCFIGVRWPVGWSNAGSRWGGEPLLTANAGGISGGHAMTIVGYNRREKYFIIRNQWGFSYGWEGHAYMTFAGFDQYAIDTWALYDMGSPLVK